MLAPTYQGYALGANGNYYFKTVYENTWYLSSHAFYEIYNSYPHAYSGVKEIEGVRVNAVMGYQWRGSKINVMAGVGTEFRSQNIIDKKEPINGAPQSPVESHEAFWLPHFELKIGVEI